MSSIHKNSQAESFRHIRTNHITGEVDYFFPMEITDPSIRALARERGLEIARTRLGNRTIDAVMVPCKDTATINGMEVFVDTPSEVQRHRYLEYVRDELAEQGDKAREIQLCEEYDNAVCELIMKTVKPRYPILLSVDVLHLHGDVRSNIDELVLMLVAQRDGTPPESPGKLPHRMWREQGNRTPEEFVEEMKKDPGQWTATQDGVGVIEVDGAVSSVCVAVKTKLEFVCCRCYQGDLWRVSWQEGNRKIGINVARIKDAETVEE